MIASILVLLSSALFTSGGWAEAADMACTQNIQTGYRLLKMANPSKQQIAVPIAGIDSNECFSRCCDKTSEGCNTAFMFRYQGRMTCLLVKCEPLSDCEWGKGPEGDESVVALIQKKVGWPNQVDLPAEGISGSTANATVEASSETASSENLEMTTSATEVTTVSEVVEESTTQKSLPSVDIWGNLYNPAAAVGSKLGNSPTGTPAANNLPVNSGNTPVAVGGVKPPESAFASPNFAQPFPAPNQQGAAAAGVDAEGPAKPSDWNLPNSPVGGDGLLNNFGAAAPQPAPTTESPEESTIAKLPSKIPVYDGFGRPIPGSEKPASSVDIFGNPVNPAVDISVEDKPAEPVSATDIWGRPIVPEDKVTATQPPATDIWGRPIVPEDKVTATQPPAKDIWGWPIVPEDKGLVVEEATTTMSYDLFGDNELDEWLNEEEEKLWSEEDDSEEDDDDDDEDEDDDYGFDFDEKKPVPTAGVNPFAGGFKQMMPSVHEAGAKIRPSFAHKPQQTGTSFIPKDILKYRNVNRPILIAALCSIVVMILLVIIFIARKMCRDKDRSRYRPLREDAFGENAYHDHPSP